MSETSMYLSIIDCELGMVTETETLVNLPVRDVCVCMTAPIKSNADSILEIF